MSREVRTPRLLDRQAFVQRPVTTSLPNCPGEGWHLKSCKQLMGSSIIGALGAKMEINNNFFLNVKYNIITAEKALQNILGECHNEHI